MLWSGISLWFKCADSKCLMAGRTFPTRISRRRAFFGECLLQGPAHCEGIQGERHGPFLSGELRFLSKDLDGLCCHRVFSCVENTHQVIPMPLFITSKPGPGLLPGYLINTTNSVICKHKIKINGTLHRCYFHMARPGTSRLALV